MATKEKLTEKALNEIQEEWEHNNAFHKKRRETTEGIRSSQVSAVIAFLVDIGVINESNIYNRKS